MRPARFICLIGISGSGKDTTGEHLVKVHGFVRVAIADQLKEVVSQVFGLDREQLWGERRNVQVPHLGRSPREVFQTFGKLCVELDPEVWVRPWRERVIAELEAGRSVVCTDVRTAPELALARALGAQLWRVDRPGVGAPGALGQHSTETDLASLPDDVFDRVIANHEGLLQLYSQIRDVFEMDAQR